MIASAANYRIYLASKPVVFRKGIDGLAAYVVHHFDRDPFCGAIFVFRARWADRLKLLVRYGTGLVLATKRLNGELFI